MDIKEFITIIEKGEVFIYPYLMKRPDVDRSVLPHFIPKMGGYKLGSITYNKYTPNVYTTLRLEGTVVMDMPTNKYDSEFETCMFMQYPLFKEGKPVTPNNKMTISGGLKELEDIRCSDIDPDGVYEIDLNLIKFDSFVQDEFSATKLAAQYKKEFTLKCAAKALKHFVNKPPKNNSQSLLREYDGDKEYVEILNKNNINDSGYHPKYYGKSSKPFLEVKLKGCSHVPKVDDVINRLQEGKKQTTAGEIMRPYVEYAQSHSSDEVIDKLAKVNQNLSKIDESIRSMNWGLFLTGSNFREFEGREDNKINVDGMEATIKWNG